MNIKSFSFRVLATAFFCMMPFFAHALTVDQFAQITGNTLQDYLPNNMASGDFNGDGYDDMVFGSSNALIGATRNGAAYVMYGSATPFTSQSIGAENVVEFAGETEYDWAGLYVGSAGDVDGDGYDDVLVGAPQNSDGAATAGAAYLIYGSATPFTSQSLSQAVQLTGNQVLQYLGISVSGIGDVDADGYDDFAIGSTFYDQDGASRGATYVVYGQAQRFTSADIDTVSVKLVGETAGDSLGQEVARVGDLNNDGYPDWMTSAYGYDGGGSGAGAAYLFYGSATRVTAGSVTGSGVRLAGEAADDGISYFISGVGDVNNDGYDDAAIGASFNDVNGAQSGSFYILYGGASMLTSQSLSAFPELYGAAAGDYFGYAVAGGDINGDGYNDLLVGAPYSDNPGISAGSTYIIYGKAEAFTSGVITDVAAETILGATDVNLLGYSTLLPDLNGDTIPEFVVTAPYSNTAANLAGSVYVGYLRVDVDEDGVLSDVGLLETGTDCNDNDATVSANQTYYLDVDGDGLGVDTQSTSVCSSTAPAGYANNTNDTNDAVVNDGVEVGGDGVDNDGDGVIDEPNTVTDNESHPAYGVVDPLDESEVDAAMVSVTVTKKGKVRVTFADDSVYLYTVFTGKQKKLKMLQYNETGYYLFMTSTGKKIALINVLNGTVHHRVTVAGAAFTKHFLQLANLRDDAVTELVVASKKGNHVRIALAGVNLTTKKLIRVNKVVTSAPGVVLANTAVVNNTIDVRSKLLPLATFLVNKNYSLSKVVQ